MSGRGIKDDLDQCPGTAVGENVDNSGCPVPEGESDSDNGVGEDLVSYGDLVVNVTPCEFSLTSLQPGQTLEINCRIDLQGQNVSIPSGVTLKYNKGEVVNGTLNFSGGYIDGELLNKDLDLQGQVQLTSPTFRLYPKRWDFVEGQTNSDRAQVNTFTLVG